MSLLWKSIKKLKWEIIRYHSGSHLWATAAPVSPHFFDFSCNHGSVKITRDKNKQKIEWKCFIRDLFLPVELQTPGVVPNLTEHLKVFEQVCAGPHPHIGRRGTHGWQTAKASVRAKVSCGNSAERCWQILTGDVIEVVAVQFVLQRGDPHGYDELLLGRQKLGQHRIIFPLQKQKSCAVRRAL